MLQKLTLWTTCAATPPAGACASSGNASSSTTPSSGCGVCRFCRLCWLLCVVGCARFLGPGRAGLKGASSIWGFRLCATCVLLPESVQKELAPFGYTRRLRSANSSNTSSTSGARHERVRLSSCDPATMPTRSSVSKAFPAETTDAPQLVDDDARRKYRALQQQGKDFPSQGVGAGCQPLSPRFQQ